MIKVKAPKAMTAVSHNGTEYRAVMGVLEIPEAAFEELRFHGIEMFDAVDVPSATTPASGDNQEVSP